MDIVLTAFGELLEFFKKFSISGFENCCNTAKRISTGLEIEIKFIYHCKEGYFHRKT